MKDLESLLSNYQKLQKNLAELYYCEQLNQGSKWALRYFEKDGEIDYWNFWVIRHDGICIDVGIQDGGGHYKRWSVHEEMALQDETERKALIEECLQTCKDKIEAEKKKWDDRLLNIQLDQLKEAVINKESEQAASILESMLNRR